MVKLFFVLNVVFLLLAPNEQHANSLTSTDAHFGDGAIILLPIEEYEDFDYDTQTDHLIYGPEISSDGRFATAISVVYGNDESSVSSYLWELDLEAFAGDVIQVRPSQVEADSIGSFSPDAVYWLTYNVSTLNFMRLTDFETVRSIPLNNNHDTLHLYAYWSPDSRYVGIVEAWENYFTVFDLETDMSETRDYYGSFGVIPIDTGWLLLGASDSGLKALLTS